MPNDVIQDRLRDLPSVEAILQAADSLIARHGRNLVVSTIRDVLDVARAGIHSGERIDSTAPGILALVEERIAALARPVLRRVVNATGIILHTGLGRATMPSGVAASLASLTGYCNVQMDMETGKRIKREHTIRELVREITGAEEALVVNNNAGATLLTLRALAHNRQVVVSRGELIEIGGSFRLPEIMEQSGAILREVGATNKTHLRDYKEAIGTDTALLLKVHKSNYSIEGFAKEVSIENIAQVGKNADIPVVDDLGCGALVDLRQFGLDHEMTIQESLRKGADIVLSSTDKLIGGPQGGLIVGRRDLLDRIRACPLYRALRVCKTTLGALEATLRLFLDPERLSATHPVYQMLARSTEQMQREAEKLAQRIVECRPNWNVSITPEKSYLGGGSLPGAHLPAIAIRLSSTDFSPRSLASSLRQADVPIVPHVQENAVFLNLRTLLPEDHQNVIDACRKL